MLYCSSEYCSTAPAQPSATFALSWACYCFIPDLFFFFPSHFCPVYLLLPPFRSVYSSHSCLSIFSSIPFISVYPFLHTCLIDSSFYHSLLLFFPSINYHSHSYLFLSILFPIILVYRRYNSSIPLKERIDTVVSWFRDEPSLNLGLLYHNEPDHTAHYHGPDSSEVWERLNNSGYTATPVTCGWAGAVFEVSNGVLLSLTYPPLFDVFRFRRRFAIAMTPWVTWWPNWRRMASVLPSMSSLPPTTDLRPSRCQAYLSCLYDD